MKKILICMSLLMTLIGINARIRTEHEVAIVVGSEDIREKVEAYIEEHETKPHEPRLDPVWQFVPGLKGIEFDFAMSYQNMLTHGQFDPSLMSGRSIPYGKYFRSIRNAL